MDSWILSLLIFLPVMGALGMCVVPFSQYKENKDVYKYIALGATGVQLLLAVILYMKFDPSLSVLDSPFTVQFDWISSFNIQYFIGIDGLSMPMVLLSALLSFLCILISWNVNKNVFGSSRAILEPMHSLAVDNTYIPFHIPIWAEIDSYNKKHSKYTGLFLAHDTGAAIKGPLRFDLFLGHGKEKEEIAGGLNSLGKAWFLIPKEVER